MKILRLRFKNINSLKNEQILDFTISPLKDTGIFAITGATGAGKSSILDAITLALYNRTPRSGALTKNAIEAYGSIITKHTFDAFAEIDYEANGHKYRSKWEISRSKNGSLRDYHMEIADLKTNQLLDTKRSEVPDKNAEIIGLSYEQFVKSILLSQGDFARFLKSTSAERGELLEKITGTFIYRQIGKAVFEKNKWAQQEVEKIENQLATIRLLQHDEIEVLVNQKSKLQQNIETLLVTIDNKGKYLQIRQIVEKLNADLLLLQGQFSATKHQYTEYQPQIEKLVLHENLMLIKSEIVSLNEFKTQLTNNLQIQTRSIQAKANLIEKKEKILILLADFKTKKIDFDKKVLELKPQIAQAKELDQTIGLLSQQIGDKDINLKKLAQKIQFQKTEISNTDKQIEDSKKRIKQLELWLNENGLLADLQRDIATIEERINAQNRYVQITEKSLKEISNTLIINELKKAKTWTERQNILTANIHSIQINLRETQSKITYHTDSTEKLEVLRDELRNKYVDFQKFSELSTNYSVLNSDIEKITSNIAIINTELVQYQKDREKTEIEIEIVAKHISEAQIRYERQQLESKYADDRKKLHEGEACFLCGSVHHPYIQHYENKIDETKLFLKQKETLHTQLTNQLKNSDLAIAKLQTEQKNSIQREKEIELNMEQILQAFTKISDIYGNYININDLAEIKRTQNEIKSKGVTLNEQILWIKAAQNLTAEIKLLSQISENTSHLLQAQRLMNEAVDKYSKYLSDADDSAKILLTLNKKQKEFDSTKDSLAKLQNEMSTAKILMEEKQTALQLLQTEFADLQNSNSDLKSNLLDKENQRKMLLKGKSVDETENRISLEDKSLNTEISANENALSKNDSEIVAIENRLTELTYSIDNLNSRIDENEKNLTPKLSELHISNSTEALTHLLNEKEALQIAKNRNQLNESLLTLQQSISDKQTDLQHNQLNLSNFESDDAPKTVAELRNEINELQANQQTDNRNIGMIKAQLDENAKKVEQTQYLHQQADLQRKEANRWATLDKLIGDAQGKRFSKFAQELTLLHLINQANKHLLNLNERYRIKKGDETVKDDLLVVDTYQGNNERSVRTLSGGESFLVSLALALGLSDLAGQNTRIESLFIDEGFGSLDQATLDMALTSLEKLQTESNRTIGIISHVESLKERIRTQIVLEKFSSGYSSLKVVSF